MGATMFEILRKICRERTEIAGLLRAPYFEKPPDETAVPGFEDYGPRVGAPAGQPSDKLTPPTLARKRLHIIVLLKLIECVLPQSHKKSSVFLIFFLRKGELYPSRRRSLIYLHARSG